MTNPFVSARLYGILDAGYVTSDAAPAVASKLLDGGVQVLQLRAKGLAPEAILPLAREIAPLCREAGVPLILNDHPGLVPLAGADGAHVGQDDMPVRKARRLAGPGKWIGKSTHSLEQARAAVDEEPDYIGFGPLFATPTKPDYTPIGLADIRTVQQIVPVPVFCIGGITVERLPEVLAAGARRVVMVSALLLAQSISETTRACREAVEGFTE